MIASKNKYTLMQKKQYASGTSNHQEHNNNDKYWDVLLSDLKDTKKWKSKKALDFACGKGRNITNMFKLCEWDRIDGIDISPGNIEYCKQTYKAQNSFWYVNNGTDISDLRNNEYHFVMSTIALQHIPVYEIRRSLITDILRTMAPGAVFSFQMGFGANTDVQNKSAYFDNSYDARGTNSLHDVTVSSEQEIADDLKDIGFVNITSQVTDTLSSENIDLDLGHPAWIWVRCEKTK